MSDGGAYGRYQLLRKLAVGGMAEVFLAKASGIAGFEKLVVIKRILPELSVEPESSRCSSTRLASQRRCRTPTSCRFSTLGS